MPSSAITADSSIEARQLRAFRADLRAARHRRGWSQERAAVAIGVQVRTYARYERGESSPYRSLDAIRRVFGVTIKPADSEPGVAALEVLVEQARAEIAELRELFLTRLPEAAAA